MLLQVSNFAASLSKRTGENRLLDQCILLSNLLHLYILLFLTKKTQERHTRRLSYNTTYLEKCIWVYMECMVGVGEAWLIM